MIHGAANSPCESSFRRYPEATFGIGESSAATGESDFARPSTVRLSLATKPLFGLSELNKMERLD
jgi:hypothetical protein